MDRYLLYMDILGFAELSVSSPDAVDELFQIMASLNLFSHDLFAAIVFSDTILVHNLYDPASQHDREYTVMFLCEFFQDLILSLVGRGIWLRAILTHGRFEHYRLNDIPYFYGPALISAYQREKKLDVTGLLMDDYCRANSSIFSTRPFDEDWHYTFVTQALSRHEKTWGATIPVPAHIIDSEGMHWYLGPELEMLAEHARQVEGASDARVRAKHAATLDQYRAQYPQIFTALEPHSFEMEAVNPDFDWSEVRERLCEKDPGGIVREPPRPGGLS